ncbi:MAG TPA: PilZ domain-containing protein [Polyangiales bacterium]
MLESTFNRRAVRRAVRTHCHAVGMQEFRLLGDRTLDLSPRGMLIACDGPTRLGDEVVVSFKAPGMDAPWLDAEARVARIIEGLRPGDPGYCVGLDFTYFEKCSRDELLTRLAGLPPPVPLRRLRTADERRHDEPRPAAVQVSKVVTLWHEPVFPLVHPKRMSHPRGVFCAA